MDKLRFWLIFTIGVAAGATAALLYAPQPGTKTRRQIRRKAGDAGDYVQDQYESASGYLKEQASELGKQAGQTYKKTKSIASEYADDLAGNLQSAVKSVKG